MRIKIILSVCAIYFVFVIVVLYINITNKNEGEDEVIHESVLRHQQRLMEAEERSDIEILQERMPWLDIISARWRRVLLSISDDQFVPGPVDYLTVGQMVVCSDYLKEIHDKFEWRYVENPTRFLPDDLIGYTLRRSRDYVLSYRSSAHRASQVNIFIDFEKEKVFFTFMN